MFKTEDLSSAVHVATRTRADLDGLLVDALVAMADRIRQLEARLDNAKPKSEDVISDALEFERNVLSVIECNSGSVYSHIEAEIEEKLDQQLGSYAFCEAVNEAIDSSSLHDAIIDAVGDAEDIVRKGLRAIL